MKSRVNDFALKIATVNGTGSASANTLLMQVIFRMGIPVSGKNLFPSNIQGLPTWYEIRVSRDGYTARPAAMDLVVAMNPETYAQDIAAVRPGGFLLYDSSWPLEPELVREDTSVLGAPFGRMCVETFTGDRERTLLRNIVYAGAIAALVEMDRSVVESTLQETFGRKPKLLEANRQALRLGYDYARDHFPGPLPFRLAPMHATADSVLIDGNTAAALGCLYAGATVGAWYPITPATSLMEAFRGFCERYRVDPATGERKFCIVQAEDELAAAGIVIGANWAGARAFTPTAGPGISLMQEFIGLAYYAEVPAVFFDVQRAGPSTGMPTRTQQADLLSLAYASHGDTKHLVLFPADPEECFRFAVQAFDLADRFQTPVFVASDLDIGMNDWMCPRLEWDDAYRPDRGKVLGKDELAALTQFHRYVASDGDAIAPRTYPGIDPKGAYFVRGSGHDKFGGYTEDADAYREVMDRLKIKLEHAGDAVPDPELRTGGNPELGIITIGGCRAAVLEALDRLREQGMEPGFLRIRGFPFDRAVRDFVQAHDRCFVIEQNRDGQLRTLLLAETGIAGDRLISIVEYGGLPLTADFVMEQITARLAEVSV